MKKSSVIFGSCEEIVEQTRKPRLIEKRIQQNVAKKKRVNAKNNQPRVTLPKNQTNKFGK